MKHVKLFLFVLSMTILIGCSASQSNDYKENSTTNIIDSQSGIQGKPLVELSDIDMKEFHASTEDGMYFLQDRDSDKAAQIMYLDYNLNICIPLCNRPNCSHDDESCTSYLAGAAYTSICFVLNNKLYVMHLINNLDDGAMAPGSIDEIDLNGENRHEILRLSDNQYFMQTGILGNENSLIFNVQETDGTTKGAETKFVTYRFDFSSGKLFRLYEEEFPTFILGALNDSILLKRIEMNPDAINDPSLYEQQNHTICKIDQNGEIVNNELISWKQGSLSTVYKNGVFYQLNSDTGEICATKFLDLSNYVIMQSDILVGSFNSISACWDGGLILSVEPEEETMERVYYLCKDNNIVESPYPYLGGTSTTCKIPTEADDD